MYDRSEPNLHGEHPSGTPFNGVGYPVVCPNTEYCAKFISYGGEDETGVILPLVIRHCGFREPPNFGLDHRLVCVEEGVTNITMNGREFQHFCCKGHLCNSASVHHFGSALFWVCAMTLALASQR
ncbi:hypothetical protein AAVH_21592 [Aphelenchoides avenae]|nr:hypothetical protein AAVH_21592 [Aphelenchus avenae]